MVSEETLRKFNLFLLKDFYHTPTQTNLNNDDYIHFQELFG